MKMSRLREVGAERDKTNEWDRDHTSLSMFKHTTCPFLLTLYVLLSSHLENSICSFCLQRPLRWKCPYSGWRSQFQVPNFSFGKESSILFLLCSGKAKKKRHGKEKGKLFLSLMCHSWIAKPPFLSPPKAMADAGLLSPPFLRDWKKGIMKWEESVRAQCIKPFYSASWVEQQHHCQAVLRKIRIFKKSESWNNSSLQPGHLWVLTFRWLLFCDAFCVSEGVAKAPVRQREARENTNETGQKSHRHKQMCKFLILGGEWAVPFCGDGT